MTSPNQQFFLGDMDDSEFDLTLGDSGSEVDSGKQNRINDLIESLETLTITLKKEKMEKEILESSDKTVCLEDKYIPFVSKNDKKYVSLYLYVFIIKGVTLNKKNYIRLCELVQHLDITTIKKENVSRIKGFTPYIYINMDHVSTLPDICLHFRPFINLDPKSHLEFMPLENLSYKFVPDKEISDTCVDKLCLFEPDLTKSQIMLLRKYTAFVVELIMIKKKQSRVNIYEAVKFRTDYTKKYQQNQSLSDKYISRILVELQRLKDKAYTVNEDTLNENSNKKRCLEE